MLKNHIRTALKNLSIISLIVTISLPMSGCSLFTRKRGFNDKSYSVEVVTDASDLRDNAYYVKHGDEYYRLYIGDATFQSDNSGSANSRVAWFGKDITRIPTMLKNDILVYHSSSDIEDSINVERFEDLGYTIGICGMQETDSGRYSFTTTPEAMNIDRNSDAGKLYQLGSRTYVMDKIGGTELRSGNISRAGTIIGLQEGKKYNIEIYSGTIVSKYTITADICAFASMDSYEIKGFDYMEGQTVSIKFPEYFNSGYYYVNGYGIVRYINDTQDIENADMNIPNIKYESAEWDDESEQETEMPPSVESADVRTFDLEEPKKIRVTINYTEDGTSYTTPGAKIIGDDGAYTLSPEGEGKLSVTADLSAGVYRLQIYEMDGRLYTYNIEEVSE